MSAEKPTVRTLAQATGLSLATVSRALSGSASVLPATRERVLSVARELHYVRDRAAVRLKTGKTQVLAFMMDRYDASQPGFKHLMLGVEHRKFKRPLQARQAPGKPGKLDTTS